MKRSEVVSFLQQNPDSEIVLSVTRSFARPEYVELKLGHDRFPFDIRTFRWLKPQLESVRSYSGGEQHYVYRLSPTGRRRFKAKGARE